MYDVAIHTQLDSATYSIQFPELNRTDSYIDTHDFNDNDTYNNTMDGLLQCAFEQQFPRFADYWCRGI